MSDRASLAGMDVLVTGGAGFVGSHLVLRLLEAQAQVRVVVQPGAPLGALERHMGRVQVAEADLTEPESVARALHADRAAIVFHLAAWTAGRSRVADPEAWRTSFRVNLEGTMNLLTAMVARGGTLPRVVRTGGMEEYGDGPVPFREDQRERAVSPYSASQAAATQASHAFASHASLPLVTLRPSLIYGPGQDRSFFLPSLIQSCLEGRDFAMTSGEQTVDFVYVDDVVEALIRASLAEGAAGEILNAGSGREIAVGTLAELVVHRTGTSARLQRGARAERAGESPRRFMDVAKAQRLLDWRASTSLEDGLDQTIESHRLGHPPSA